MASETATTAEARAAFLEFVYARINEAAATGTGARADLRDAIAARLDKVLAELRDKEKLMRLSFQDAADEADALAGNA